MTAIDIFLQNIDSDKRHKLERIRAIAKETIPEATETISYGMPTLQYKGKSFLGFNIHKNHIGIYPYGGEEIVVFGNELKDFKTSSGAIQVPFNIEFPKNLLVKIIQHRLKRITI